MSIACTTVNGNLTVRNMITRDILKIASNVCREVDEVREERFRRTDLKEIETNEERQRFVNPCPHFSLLSIHISVMALDIDWLSEEQMMQIDMQSNAKS